MIKEITAHLLSHSGLSWVLGENFFEGHLPLKTMTGAVISDRVMVILERTPAEVNGYLPDYQGKMIQIWNRSRNYFEARQDAEEIYAILHGSAGIDLPVVDSPDAFYVMACDAIGTPAPIANPNENNLFEFSTNYILRTEGNPPVP